MAALGDRPDDQRLAAAGVAGGEDAGARRSRSRRGDVAAGVEVQRELLDDALVLRVQEAHRQQHEVGAELELAALDLLEARRRAHLVAAQLR